jgi:uncharacterized integral membrane protein
MWLLSAASATPDEFPLEPWTVIPWPLAVAVVASVIILLVRIAYAVARFRQRRRAVRHRIAS